MPKYVKSSGSCRGVAVLLFLSVAGCSSITGPSVPTLNDPQQASEVALKTYDADGDGRIAGAELEKCHPLKSELTRIDTNRDGAITADEIAQLIEAYQSQSTFVGVIIHVFKGGVPLDGATVTLTPEPFMGDGFQVFEGTSDASGAVGVQGRDSVTPGLPTGLYTVTISHPASNTDKTTGCEVSDDAGNRLDFTL